MTHSNCCWLYIATPFCWLLAVGCRLLFPNQRAINSLCCIEPLLVITLGCRLMSLGVVVDNFYCRGSCMRPLRKWQSGDAHQVSFCSNDCTKPPNTVGDMLAIHGHWLYRATLAENHPIPLEHSFATLMINVCRLMSLGSRLNVPFLPLGTKLMLLEHVPVECVLCIFIIYYLSANLT